MIRHSEIQKLAGKDGVRDTQTEKDYILFTLNALRYYKT